MGKIVPHQARNAVLAFGILAVWAPLCPASTFDPDSLRVLVQYLADDELEGRGAGTEGLLTAARFIADRFRDAGLQPAGDDGTFFQEFDVTLGVRPTGRNQLRIAKTDLEFETDWMAYGFSDTGTTRAPLVFAGYGITAPEFEYDDYEGLDVSGKVVIVLRFEPAQDDSTSAFEGTLLTAHADLRRKAIVARDRGAVGLLAVTGPGSSREDRLARLRSDEGYYSTGIACGQVTREALVEALPGLRLATWQDEIDSTGRPASTALEETEIDWTVGLAKKRSRLTNVIGQLPGSDPHQALLIGAHYDHLGMGGPSSLAEDTSAIHNGADDNASGTAALIVLARHFARSPRPQRTLLFAAFSGEEIGLAGSAHYVENPTHPIDLIPVMLNMDMIGRLRDRKLLILGTGTALEFPDLLGELNDTGPRFELRLRGDGFGPSDQMSFYKKGIPVLHFFTGAHSDYHKPSDDADLVNYEGLSDVTRFVATVTDRLMDTKLTLVSASQHESRGDGSSSGFRSYLGTVPDYGQDEDLDGVLLAAVRGGSPAEKAGIQEGDVITRIGDTQIHNLHDFAHVLRTRQPGDQVPVTILRNGESKTLHAVLGQKR